MAVLKIERGMDAGTSYFIDKEVTIGRDASSAKISISDQKASRVHAKIIQDGNAYFLEDLQSKNGTFLNGKPVTKRENLVPGDYIRIGFTWISFGEDLEMEKIRKQLPGYSILQEIKKIGSCLSFKSQQIGLDRFVTLNLLPPNIIRTNPQLKERFRQQVRSLAKLSHDNISVILDFDAKESYLYFTTEYLEGETLASLLSREKKLSVEKTLEIGIALAKALGHAYSQHIIHQDITPFNIGIGGRRIILSGFGLSSIFDDVKEDFYGLIGKTEYLSPEQITKQKVDYKTDIYAMGTILYECLAGRPPFYHENPEEIVNAITNNTPPALTNYDPAIPGEVEDWIYRCLDKDPAQRPNTYEEIAAKFEDILYRQKVIELRSEPDIYTSASFYFVLQLLENPLFAWCFFPSLSFIFLVLLSLILFYKK